MKEQLYNRKISTAYILPSPAEICESLAPSPVVVDTVMNARKTIINILNGDDPRLLCVVGPCSIHDEGEARDYALGLSDLSKELQSTFFIVMRTYFEKPRSIGGWKGFLNDPHLDGSFRIDEGIRRARNLLLHCGELGLPVATEMLDLISPQYLADLVSWSAIGARTTESQSHRELASGLSMPVGFKNATNGDIGIAINAIRSAGQPHHILSVDEAGHAAIFGTTGNPDCHVVLRGGEGQVNYDEASIDGCVASLQTHGLKPSLVVDCSHGNSGKNYQRQHIALNSVVDLLQRRPGCGVRGVMLESNLSEGSQPFSLRGVGLKRGVSITDSCIGWDETVHLLRSASEKLGYIERAERRVA
jgi:3-deoxy-7-phosphoheptulonate synthase